MTQAAHLVLQNALSLDEKDRALLAAVLLESLESDQDEGVEDAWLLEVQRRVAELDSGGTKTIPLETAMSRLRKRIVGNAGN